jgi:hypothetical protein
MENDNQKAISKLLGLDKELSYGKGECASWPTIYAEIGRLQERASQPPQVVKEFWPNNNHMPLNCPEQRDVHYHNGIPCYSNPCTWC